jgi:PhnB protein
MRFNRSAPHARVVPVLTVSDVRAAVAWYERTFGFVEHVKIGDGHRAQLGLPGGAAAELIVAEVRPGWRLPTADRSHQILLKVEDVAATLAGATASGATIADEPRDHPYGERQAGLTDPFGHQWVLTQTLVDTAPEDWGGRTMRPR